jgi:hypothetical protein
MGSREMRKAEGLAGGCSAANRWRMRPRGGLAGLLLAAAVSCAAAEHVSGQEPAVEYRMSVRIEAAEGTLAARVEMRFPGGADGPRGATDTLVFLLHGELRVDSVAVGGTAVPFTEAPRFWELDYALVANEVRVPVEGLDLSRGAYVGYSGPFNPSRARTRSDYMRIDAEGAYLRGYFYSPWFPVRDEGMDPQPISFERVEIDTPATLTAVFAGERLGERVESGRRISTWRAVDLPPEHAQLTARPYRRVIGEGVTLYSLSDSASIAATTTMLGAVQAWETFYRQRYGPPRGEAELHVLQMPRYGDIASGMVIGIAGDNWTGFDPGSWQGRTLAHEMVHAYVQVPIQSADPLFALVVEGFPSYFHLPALEATLGTAFYREWILAADSVYLEKRRTGEGRRGAPLPVEQPIDEIAPDEIGNYKDTFVLSDRVPLFLDWVRRQLGDDSFFEWAKELFARDGLSLDAFLSSLAPRLGPDRLADLRLWLSTTEYPKRFRP